MDSYGLELFLSTPSARRATIQAALLLCADEDFYPRPPRGGRRDVLLRAAAHSSISIHALREEGDAGSSCGASCRSRFLSTPSARRATGLPGRSAGRPDNFYPRPPRGGRQVCRAEAPAGQIISIHALREEGDTSAAENLAVAGVFLSTPSARRATRVRNQPHRRKDNFYPRPPRGGRHCRDCQRNHTWRFLSTPSARRATPQLRRPTAHRAISIHALREEGDGCSTTTTPSQTYFYPRPPRGGRLPARPAESHDQRISIHALREEGDADGGIWKLEAKKFLSTPSARRATRPCTRISTTPSDFYPRPPRGGRLSRSGNELHPTQFLSTPSARRATGSPVILFLESEFLSTPSARRATTSCRRHSPRQRGFLSTPSARRATGPVGTAVVGNAISIHALREEGDTSYTRRGDFSMEFLSTPSARRATRDATTIANGMRNFYPRPPRGGRQPSCSAIPRPWNFYPRPPRGGRRLQCLVTWSSHRYFYPRPPRGGRPRSGSCTFQVILFLSTPSARRATSTRLSRRIPF